MHEIMMEHDSFCVNFLPEHRREWSDWWAGKAPKDADQFADIPHKEGTTGSPVLEGCLGYIDCKVWERYPGGDHTLVLGEVQDAEVNTDPNVKPLLFFASKYHQLGAQL
jgi:flavin reductase (DIM6/NTAB) family NADH-FMN oxidoreductase RutF